eukprot:1305022-Amphidinium_carterae.2
MQPCEPMLCQSKCSLSESDPQWQRQRGVSAMSVEPARPCCVFIHQRLLLIESTMHLKVWTCLWLLCMPQ